MDVYEIVEIVSRGDHHYAQIAAWRDGGRKTRGDGDVNPDFGGVTSRLRCDLANDFKCFYQSTGTRIVEHIRAGIPSWYNTRLRAFVPIVTAIQNQIAGPWETESFSRDLEAEITRCVERYMLRANRKLYTGDRRGTTLNLQVTTGADDTYRNGGAFQNAVGTARVGFSGLASQSASARFTGISGLTSVTIDSAEIVVVGGGQGGTPLTKIWFNKATAPAAPTSGAEFDALTLTTAAVDWDNPGTGSVGVEVTSPDVSAPLQEIVDASLNPSALQWVWGNDGGTGTNYSEIFHYDAGVPSWAPMLDVDYSAGGGGGGSAKRVGQRFRLAGQGGGLAG